MKRMRVEHQWYYEAERGDEREKMCAWDMYCFNARMKLLG
jgi:hypothetical protein